MSDVMLLGDLSCDEEFVAREETCEAVAYSHVNFHAQKRKWDRLKWHID